MTIEPFDLRQPVKYDLVIDRLTHWYSISREWIKKAIVLNDLYVYNNPWSIQSNEKHTSYCAMMRLGLPVPETWMLPPKAYEHDRRPRSRRSGSTPGCSRWRRSARRSAIPFFMKPYDGGGWRGVTKIDDLAGFQQRLRRQRHRSDAPAEGGDPLRLVRALHRARAADAQGELRPLRAAARPLHAWTPASCRPRTRRCSRT